MEPGYSVENPIHLDKVAVAGNLQEHVQQLANHIGERNIWRYQALMQASHYIQHVLRKPQSRLLLHSYECHSLTVHNVIAEHVGWVNPEQVIIIGAHYDTAKDAAGVNDNASGIAALLEINRLLLGHKTAKTIRLVAFVNAARPFQQTEEMGSYIYASQLKTQNQQLLGVLVLEAIACCFTPLVEKKSWLSPINCYLKRNSNAISLVSDIASRSLLSCFAKPLCSYSQLHVKHLTVPSWLPYIRCSDHWSFWQHRIPAIMATCGPFYYSHCTLKPEELNYVQMAQLVLGLANAILALANTKGAMLT
jgi:hypothetical protein